jgi:beta-glucosidase
MASALTLGVQENNHCAVTVKHYCCNNQEDNRMKSSSEINERALREIYLKAFKWTIKAAHPKCVMSSYNKVNGTYVNSSYDLIINTLRCEFGFNGLVMTDWQSVAKNQAVAGEVLSAENDLIMPGDTYQQNTLLEAVKSGKVAKGILQKSASRILNLCKELSIEDLRV